MLRRKRKSLDPVGHVDPASVPARFAPAVRDALAARARWRDLLGGLRPGPVRDRLDELSERVDAGVLAVWDAVQRAADLAHVAASLDAERVTDDYKRAKRDAAADPALVAALTERFTATQRLLNAVDGVDDQLRLLDARLGAAVARAAEVVLAAGAGTDELGAELDAVVSELGALRTALTDFRV